MKFARPITALVIYGVFCVVLLWPLFYHPFSTVPDDYDGLFITWTMNWVQHVVTNWPIWSWSAHLYHAPILAPLPFTYTFSDPFFTAALIGLPFQLLTHEPILSLTVNTLLAVILTALFSYAFIWELSKNFKLSLALGAWIGFGVTHLSFLGHLHVLMIQWIPLALFAWVRFTKSKKNGYFFLFLFSFVLQVLNSPFAGYLFVASVWPVIFTPQSWKIIRQKWKLLIASTLMILFMVGVFYIPFFMAAHYYQSYRSIRDAAHFALSVNELFSPQRVSRLYWLIWPLCVYALFRIIKMWRKRKSFFSSSLDQQLHSNFLLAGIITTVLALGPALKWMGETVKIPFPIPLPYALVYFALPGFSAFRTPSRWLMASQMCLGFFLALALPKKYISWISIGVLFVLLFLEAQPFSHFVTLPTFQNYPAVYSALTQLPSGSILYLPPYTYDMPNAKQEVYRMLFSLKDQTFSHPMYNGYSGFAPYARMDEMNEINQHPFSSITEKALIQNRIHYVIFQTAQVDQKNQDVVRDFRKKAIYSDSDYVLFNAQIFEFSCHTSP